MSVNILLVDDDPAGLFALSAALQRHLNPEVIVDTAPGSKNALAFMSVKPYDLLLCDVRMAEMDGIGLLVEVKRRWPTIPVILFTAGGPGREKEAVSAGAHALIEKPIDLEQLLGMIEATVKRTNLKRRIQEANSASISNFKMKWPEGEGSDSSAP
jgi:DNA-binding NtrC family response regulator